MPISVENFMEYKALKDELASLDLLIQLREGKEALETVTDVRKVPKKLDEYKAIASKYSELPKYDAIELTAPAMSKESVGKLRDSINSVIDTKLQA